MNDIAFTLGSFTGGLVICVISWKLGTWLAGTMTRNAAAAAFLGAVLAFWYANTRDDTAAIWGAWIAFVFMAVTSGATKPPDRE